MRVRLYTKLSRPIFLNVFENRDQQKRVAILVSSQLKKPIIK